MEIKEWNCKKLQYQIFNHEILDANNRSPDMYQIQLTEESVEVSASDFVRDGGPSKREWPWKTLYNNQGESDKWTVNDNSGWIIFKFKRPI